MSLRYLYAIEMPIIKETDKWNDLMNILSFNKLSINKPVPDGEEDRIKSLGRRFMDVYEEEDGYAINCPLIDLDSKEFPPVNYLNFAECKIERLFISQNRYQECLYFKYIISLSANSYNKENISDSYELPTDITGLLGLKHNLFKNIRNYIENKVNALLNNLVIVDTFSIIIKFSKNLYALHSQEDKNLEYSELLNPAPIIINNESWDSARHRLYDKSDDDVKNGEKHFIFETKTGYPDKQRLSQMGANIYPGKKNKKYVRVRCITYYSEQSSDFEYDLPKIIKHYTNAFLMYHRSTVLSEELNSFDEYMTILNYIESDLRNSWAFGRIELLSSKRFYDIEFDNTLFDIFETNTQVETANAKLLTNYQQIKEKYELQFERALFNNESNEKYIADYYEKLMTDLMSYINTRIAMIEQLIDLYQPIKKQIADFRENNNTRINANIQWVMSVLTFLTIFWGVFIASAENIFTRDINTEKNPLLTDMLIPFLGVSWPITLTIGILIFLILTMIFLCFTVKLNHHTYNKTLKGIVQKLKSDAGSPNLENQYKKALEILNQWKEDSSNSGTITFLKKNKLYQGLLILLIYDMYATEFEASSEIKNTMIQLAADLSTDTII